MIDKPGIYFDITAVDYHADPCPAPSFTQSIGKVLLEKSPAHARLIHPRLCPPPVTADDDVPEKYVAAQAIGDAAHALLIGRGKAVAVGDYDGWRSKEAKAFREEALAAGKVAITAKHMARAWAMVGAASAQLGHADHDWFFSQAVGAGEVVVAWQEDDIWLRTMVDWMNVQTKSVIVDYKTSSLSCAPHAVEDRPSVMSWDLQAAMHERGLDAVDPDNAGRRKHFYVNQENEPPYALTVVQIGEADLTMGRKKLAMAIDIWSRCMATNTWPAYPAETVMSRPRGYLETKWLEREVEHHEHHERRDREPMLTDLTGG
jgi:hypothetical protein